MNSVVLHHFPFFIRHEMTCNESHDQISFSLAASWITLHSIGHEAFQESRLLAKLLNCTISAYGLRLRRTSCIPSGSWIRLLRYLLFVVFAIITMGRLGLTSQVSYSAGLACRVSHNGWKTTASPSDFDGNLLFLSLLQCVESGRRLHISFLRYRMLLPNFSIYDQNIASTCHHLMRAIMLLLGDLVSYLQRRS